MIACELDMTGPWRPRRRLTGPLAAAVASVVFAGGCGVPVTMDTEASSVPLRKAEASKPVTERAAGADQPRDRRPHRPESGGPGRTARIETTKARPEADWYRLGMRDGAGWKRRGSTRGTFDPKEVGTIADMMTSNYYSKGLKNNPEGQKRYMEGFCKAVLGR